MALFFFLVGLEIKREVTVGELSEPRDAVLAVVAAVGGVIVPGVIYAAINWGGEGIGGWGIPVATDIAFALGMMALLGDRVPLSLKVFLTALAIVDDLVAVLLIAVFYTSEISPIYLVLVLGVLALAFAYGRGGGRNLKAFALVGVIAWFFVLQSGVHATVVGILLAMIIPVKRKIAPENLRDELKTGLESQRFEEAEVKVANLERVLEDAQSPLHRLEHSLHPWVAFLVLPIFALFNAGVSLGGGSSVLSPITAGVFLGLLLGKPIGVLVFSWLATRLGWASLPEGVGWKEMGALGYLRGSGSPCRYLWGSWPLKKVGFWIRLSLGCLQPLYSQPGWGWCFLDGEADNLVYWTGSSYGHAWAPYSLYCLEAPFSDTLLLLRLIFGYRASGV
jgi:NhaA family Na+:H+ antiporter